MAAGSNPSYYKYLDFKKIKIIRADYNLDKSPDLKIDLNQSLPLDNNSIDNIFLFNVIYIIKNPKKLLKEIHRVLKKGGRLFISSPFIFNEAREPNDFRRLTSQGLERALGKSGFSDFEIIPYGERFSVIVYLLHNFFIFNFIRLIAFSKALLFDKLIPKKIKKLHPCPLGYFIIAKK
ncbi:methyltransferase domain-containing protein [Candidatus Parcubacteria bacterium]|nr:methyltransferase domain-containing protein [Candidatus Parcubacteria bacterium]